MKLANKLSHSERAVDSPRGGAAHPQKQCWAVLSNFVVVVKLRLPLLLQFPCSSIDKFEKRADFIFLCTINSAK